MAVYIQRCIIIPVTNSKSGRDLCAGLAGEAGANMFLVGACSPSGNLPATHYVNEGMIEDNFAALLPLTGFSKAGVATTKAGQPDTITALAKGLASLTQVKGLLDSIEVTEEPPFAALARRGLKLIQSTTI